MDGDFWHARWRNDEIAWHQEAYNEALTAFWPSLGMAAEAAVLVPLCGKSRDMHWLAAQGHRVVGAELSALAIQAFFEEAGIEATTDETAGYRRHRGGAFEILEGDFLTLPPALVGPVAGAYDRGGLVALPSTMRESYARQLLTLCGPETTILLLTLDYDGDTDTAPPFAVSGYEVETLFAPRCRIQPIEQQVTDALPPALKARGIGEATQTVYRLDVR